VGNNTKTSPWVQDPIRGQGFMLRYTSTGRLFTLPENQALGQ
jgi:hypothetical protein